jgi:hypothetical protein
MDTSPLQVVQTVIESFRVARAKMNAASGGADATAAVLAVRQGLIPREGVLDDGLEYFVHGVGYTVVMPSEAQAHIDAGSAGDMFTNHDIRTYLRTAEDGQLPVLTIEEIRDATDKLSSDGKLVELIEGMEFALPEWR